MKIKVLLDYDTVTKKLSRPEGEGKYDGTYIMRVDFLEMYSSENQLKEKEN